MMGTKTKADAIAKVYLHCRRCIEERVVPDIEAFVDHDGKLFVWCRNHDCEVFHTKEPAVNPAALACEACQKGVEHAH